MMISRTLALLASVAPALATKPAAFYLAGDSTTAAQSSGGGGWGVGFLATLTDGAIGTDLGYNGDTTASFVAGGAWANVIDAVTRSKVSYQPYVTIQFGHNDQKNTSGVTLEDYATNLQTMAEAVVTAGGIPILVTPISRRTFNSTTGTVIEDLATQRNITISVAESIAVDYIDLNEASTVYLDAIGATDAASYNRISTDYTHLNPVGSVVFGNMVSWLLLTTTSLAGNLADYTVPNAEIVAAIANGTYIYPEV
ncbi:SGNH hydrolase [Aspergillus fijiensis CBS 313.89]|uniref:SGNH hydrolase n=1 Tax=Aspergillus fijiensis CBS 313.89 TaxID=1448319 RepID=A0A8G1S1D1_9EURO|nr:SGNH hydrolase [Aspergillus fijiensis CBS 313.89]RAK81566.1 SGNH hydrolase [Aspergillus fijiensis CBS 313.89]